VGDSSLRGSSKRDALAVDDERRPARSRSIPSGSVRGSAAGGQAGNEAKPTGAGAKRTEDVAQRNEALPLRSRLTGALREPNFQVREPRKCLVCRRRLKFRCDFDCARFNR
jgi:hypothetical protein